MRNTRTKWRNTRKILKNTRMKRRNTRKILGNAFKKLKNWFETVNIGQQNKRFNKILLNFFLTA